MAKLFSLMAREIDRAKRGLDTGAPFADMAQDELQRLAREYLPSGSGFDSGCYIELDESRRDKIVIRCDFHHLNENGFYSGWTTHRAIVTPCLLFGFALRITGKDKDGIKEYIADSMHCALSAKIKKDSEQ